MIVSLKESCLRILTAHSGGLLEVGNCPYRLVRPVLFACQPDQLAYIEDQSPHLMLDSDEIWALHLTRDYPTEKPSSPLTRNLDAEDDQLPTDVDLPANRIKYFDVRLAKEEALASASARLRQRTIANRSDSSKRKAIFTGQTDYGIGSKKKKLTPSKSWTTTPPPRKTLADKARQQVKKSAAVYANAARAKPIDGTPSQLPSVNEPRTQSTARITLSTRTPIFSIRKPNGKAPVPKCVVRTTTTTNNTQVKLISKPINTTNPTTTNSQKPDIKPTPFPKPYANLKPTKMIEIKTNTRIPIVQSSSSSSSSVMNPIPPTAALLKLSSTTSKKTSSLFMPKSKKPPPPPLTSRSLTSSISINPHPNIRPPSTSQQ